MGSPGACGVPAPLPPPDGGASGREAGDRRMKRRASRRSDQHHDAVSSGQPGPRSGQQEDDRDDRGEADRGPAEEGECRVLRRTNQAPPGRARRELPGGCLRLAHMLKMHPDPKSWRRCAVPDALRWCSSRWSRSFRRRVARFANTRDPTWPRRPAARSPGPRSCRCPG